MKKQLLIIISLLVSLSLTGCIHRRPIRQGNLIKASAVAQLHNGLTKQRVSQIMGTPLLENTFNQNRWDYVYTIEPYKQPRLTKRVSVIFRNNQVVQVIKAQPMKTKG